MPAVGKVRFTLQAADDGEAGMSYELSSKCTLWIPPALFHVTVSPALTSTFRGVNWLPGVAVTVWLTARAGADCTTSASIPTSTPTQSLLLT